MYNKKFNPFLSKSELFILSEFTNGFKNALYARELSRRYGMSVASVNLALRNLYKIGILSLEETGRTMLYRVKNDDIAFEYLGLAEIYKKINFVQRNLIAGRVVNLISPLIVGSGAIFGSYSSGTQKDDSDLDVFVAGTIDKEKTRKIADTYNLDISLKVYPFDEFVRLINKDILIKEVINNHIIIRGFEGILSAVRNLW